MIRVVLDPGVLVSALIGRRGASPDLVVRAWDDDRIEVVASQLLVEELERVLRRPKFESYVAAPTVTEYLARVRRHAAFAQDPPSPPPTTRDRGDDYLVALALQAGVDALISGDRDLVDAGLAAPQIWTPRALVERLAR